jgi:hypothetical protein
MPEPVVLPIRAPLPAPHAVLLHSALPPFHAQAGKTIAPARCVHHAAVKGSVISHDVAASEESNELRVDIREGRRCYQLVGDAVNLGGLGRNRDRWLDQRAEEDLAGRGQDGKLHDLGVSIQTCCLCVEDHPVASCQEFSCPRDRSVPLGAALLILSLLLGELCLKLSPLVLFPPALLGFPSLCQCTQLGLSGLAARHSLGQVIEPVPLPPAGNTAFNIACWLEASLLQLRLCLQVLRNSRPPAVAGHPRARAHRWASPRPGAARAAPRFRADALELVASHRRHPLFLQAPLTLDASSYSFLLVPPALPRFRVSRWRRAVYSSDSQLRIGISGLGLEAPGSCAPGNRHPFYPPVLGIGVGKTDDLALRQIQHQWLPEIRLFDRCQQAPRIFSDHGVVKHFPAPYFLPCCLGTRSISRQGRGVRGVLGHSVQ